MKTNLLQLALVMIFVFSGLMIFAQGGNLGNVPLGNPNDLIGWDGTAGTATDLIVENAFNTGTKNIFFKTHNGTTLLQRMMILANGKVGVNTFSVSTNSQFEVSNDINLTTSILNNGYRIADSIVVQKPGFGNLFLGAGVGMILTS
ncbi:MAG: hypothetical protein ABI763_16415 [Bacteroidota bacterium]